MKKSNEYIFEYERDLVEKDQDRDTMFRYIRKMAHIDWDFDTGFKQARPDIRTIRDSTPSDAIENASIALSNTLPMWQVLPYGSNMAEYERTERMEEIIRCEFRKSNRRGAGTVLFDKARSALLYNMQATRIDDLAQILPKDKKRWTNLQKEAWASGRFMLRVFDPITVHCDVSMMGLTSVCLATVARAWDVYKYWELYADSSDEGKMVKAALAKMKEKMDDWQQSKKPVRELMFSEFYFINHDQVLRHGHFTPLDGGTGTLQELGYPDKDDIIFADAENDSGFINWSIRMGGSRIESDAKYQLNPMLASLYYSNVWETVNIIKSIVLSKPIAELERAGELQTTKDGKRLPERDGVMVGMAGDTVQRIPFPQIDPRVYDVLDRLDQSIVRSTGASALGDVTSAKNTPFATLNAIIQVVMGRLDIQRRDIALSCADDAINMFKWVEANGVPLKAYRAQSKNYMNRQRTMGEQLVITRDDFDPYELDIMCDINPKTPTDYQQQVLTAIQLHDKTPLPWRELLQKLGFENTDLLKEQRILEDFDDAEIQAAIQNIMTQAEMKAQQAAQAQAATNMPQPGGGLSETAFGPLGGMQGNNPAMGGTPPAMMEPGLTREAVSGQDMNGRSI